MNNLTFEQQLAIALAQNPGFRPIDREQCQDEDEYTLRHGASIADTVWQIINGLNEEENLDTTEEENKPFFREGCIHFTEVNSTGMAVNVISYPDKIELIDVLLRTIRLSPDQCEAFIEALKHNPPEKEGECNVKAVQTSCISDTPIGKFTSQGKTRQIEISIIHYTDRIVIMRRSQPPGLIINLKFTLDQAEELRTAISKESRRMLDEWNRTTNHSQYSSL